MVQTPKWEIFEESFHVLRTFENPFAEVEIQAVFEGSGAHYTVDGFYDGDDVWRVRFSPMHEGMWRYTTHSNIAELDNLTGSFECVKAVSRGPLCLSPQFPNWFFRSDGEAQLILNDGWFPHTANGHELPFEDLEFQQPSEKDFDDYFDILAGYGVNMVVGMSELYARQKSITDQSFVWPWRVVDAEKNLIDRERFNLEFYRRWEHSLAHAASLDMFYAFELLYDDSLIRPREWNNHPYNVKNGGWLASDPGTEVCWRNLFDIHNEDSKKYLGRCLRYTLARLACFRSVVWEIGAENANLAVLPARMLPNALMPVERVAEWYIYWSRFVARHDPYGRLRTMGDTTFHPLMVRAHGNDFVLTQDPRNYPRGIPEKYYRAMRDYGTHYWQYARPMVIGEMTSSNNGNYERERRMYWIGMTSGYAMGRSDRHFAPVRDGKLTEREKFGLSGDPVIYEYMRSMRRYVESSVAFWRMRPANELVQSDLLTCTLAAENEEYLIYFLFGGSAKLTIPYSKWELFDPRTGRVENSGTAPAGEFRFTVPKAEDPALADWVLHIKALPPKP
ncbi:MAG: DUF5060 domain-containing protein [Clostridia bacterium]|nr:DUF5060 domain-containing protein [Clostridia bacterium]